MFCFLALFFSLFELPVSMPSSSCRVDSFHVKQNFDFNKFLGRWYFLERSFPDTALPYKDNQHSYIQDGSGRADVFHRRRHPDGQCEYEKGKLYQPLSGSGVDAAKLRYKISGTSITVDYWVISTDYNNYAVVYSCFTKMTNGKCSVHYSFVFVRSVVDGLSPADSAIVNASLSEVCLEGQQFVPVLRTQTECRQCDRLTWTVQPAFDLTKYLGVWYDIVFKPPFAFPRHLAFNNFVHDYGLLQNGNVSNSASGRNLSDNNQCFVSTGQFILFTTAIAGQLTLIDHPGDTADDYWVIETDYTGYAFVLGCVREPTTPAGQCEGFRSWVFSRKPYLNSFQFIRFTKLFDQYCINEDEYFITTHDNPCP